MAGSSVANKKILGEHARRLRQRVEERRLAGIGVADERHDRIGHARSALRCSAACLHNRFELLLEP